MKKFFLGIYSFMYYLFSGIKRGNDVIMGDTNSNDSLGGGVEAKDEEKSVYKDLLRGELTKEVLELRHETYYAERESKHYSYIGNGVARKKNKTFSYSGKYENSDGLDVQLVQFNKEYSENLSNSIEDTSLDSKLNRKFSFTLYRKFIPRFRLEKYTNKFIVKRPNDNSNKVIIDFYVSTYVSQFDRRQRIFYNELNNIYEGNVRSEILEFEEMNFVSDENTFGCESMVYYKYNNFNFITIKKFDGNYVLRFSCDVIVDGDDKIVEFFDADADRKFKNKEAREGKSVIEFDNAVLKNEEKVELDEAKRLLKEFEGDINF